MSLPRPTSQPPPNRRWPLTTEAWSSLTAEIARLEGDVAGERRPNHVIPLPSADPVRRLRALRELHGSGVIDDSAGVAAIGRRVTIAEDDGTVETYALVFPGDGDPLQGWVSADSPLGSAVLGARPGDAVDVAAPAGLRSIRVLEIE